MPNPKITEDPRIDPRIKAMFGELDVGLYEDVPSREHMLERAKTPEAIEQREMLKAFMEMCDKTWPSVWMPGVE